MSTDATAGLRGSRLAAHGLTGESPPSTPAEVVRRLGAMQAQDLGAAKWAIGSRLHEAVVSDIDDAIDRREIVRSWPFRGTLHFMAPELLRPVLSITGPRLHRATTARRAQLELDDDVYGAARAIAERLLAERPHSRDELHAAWTAAGIAPGGQRGYHLLAWLARDGVICLGPVDRGDQRFALLAEWVPDTTGPPDRDETLATLVTAYFRGHGPATEQDAAWWTGLPLRDIRTGVAAAGDALATSDGTAIVASEPEPVTPAAGRLVLAAFDEYFLGYADRSAICEPRFAGRVVPGSNGVFRPLLVDAGRIVGTWRRRDARGGTTVALEPFEGDLDPGTFESAFTSWARFRGVPVTGFEVVAAT